MLRKKIGFLRGTFKLLHPGHIKLIQDCSSIVDELFILIDSDSRLIELKKPIIMNEEDRKTMLKAINGVYEVLSFESEDDFFDAIEVLSRDLNVGEVYYFKGGDYAPNQLPEKNSVEKLGAIVCCVGYSEGYSTTNLINKIRNGGKNE